MTEGSVVAWRVADAVAVPIDRSVYSMDAVLRAAYRFTDRAFIVLKIEAAHTSRMFALFSVRNNADLSVVILEFQNELLDQQLRCSLEAKFSDVRTLIVAQAFSEGNLIDPVADSADYRIDSLGAGLHR